jgi:hypothetical protein
MDELDKVCHLYLTMSIEYEMTVTALRTLPEENKKLAMVKNKLLEEESKRIMKRNIMKQEYHILASCCIVLFNGFCRLCYVSAYMAIFMCVGYFYFHMPE